MPFQEHSLHGRTAAGQINGKGNALAGIAAENGTGGGGAGGGAGLDGSNRDIADLDGLICGRQWDHEQVEVCLHECTV